MKVRQTAGEADKVKAEFTRKLEDKQKEVDGMKEELSQQVHLKNEIFDLKAKIEELTEDVTKKDDLLTKGSSIEIRETEIYKSLQRDYNNLTKDYEAVRADLSNAQYEIRENMQRAEFLESENLDIKFRSNILEKFFSINAKNPK